jgi:hypothetical protein
MRPLGWGLHGVMSRLAADETSSRELSFDARLVRVDVLLVLGETIS